MQNKERKGIFKKIRLTVFDVDGVLTDGRLYYGVDGDFFKVFNAKDGLGITRLSNAGHLFGIITGRESPFVLKRAKDIGIKYVFQGCLEKLPVFEALRKDLGLDYEQMRCFVCRSSAISFHSLGEEWELQGNCVILFGKHNIHVDFRIGEFVR